MVAFCLCLCLMLVPTVISTNYNLRPGSSSESCTILNEPVLNCSDISTLLLSIQSLEPVTVTLSPGEYTLLEENFTLDYSLSIISLERDAVISCRPDIDSSPANISQITFSNVSHVSFSGVTFRGCYSLRMDEVDNVTINDCIFRDFLSPSVDIKNSLTITILNTSFINNSVTTNNQRFRADAAGLSLSYFFSSYPQIPRVFVNVTNCTFKNNRGEVPSQLLSQQISQVLNQQYYPARGGALGIIITERYVNVTGIFEDIHFLNNYAESFGGAVYIGLDGREVAHSLKFRRCKFIHNVCDGGAGAFLIAYLKIRHDEQLSVTVIEDSEFINNTAHTGGGILSLQTRLNGSHDYLVVRRSAFTGNKGEQGAAIAFASLFNVQTQDTIIPSIVENCNFTAHDSNGGTLIAGFTHIALQGANDFIDNRGPTLRVIGCLLLVRGSLSFIGNDVTISGGAAMHFTAFAQMKLYKTAQIFFINNTGILGASIRVDLQRFPSVFTQLLFNPLCFILYEDENTAPVDWNPRMIHFHGNHAQLGSVMYMSYFDLCSYYSSDRDNYNNIFSIKSFPSWPVFEFGENNNTFHEDSTNSSYYMQTPAITIDVNSFTDSTISLRPGEDKTLHITGLDQFNNPTYFVARVIDENESLRATLSSLFTITDDFNPPADYSEVYMGKNEVSAIFSPSLLPVYPNKSSEVEYTLRLPSSVRTQQLTVYTASDKRVLVQIDNPNGIAYNYLNLSFHVLPCPPGYDLQVSPDNNAEYTCVCTGARDDPFAVLDCDESHDAILLRNGYWAGFDREEAVEDSNPNLDVYTCPITYCQCMNDNNDNCITEYSYSQPNQQCHPPRIGTLCGQCGDNTTVTILRLQCKEGCEGNYHIYYATAILIIVYVLVIVAVLLASVKLGITFPHSMRPILFYIQTVYYTTEYFPISFWNSRQYMLYLGNLLGLYFPVDFCFLSKAPSVLLFLPRFIPPFLVFIVPFFFLRWKRGRRKIFHGLWSLILVTYAPLCYTCMMLLHCPILADINGSNDVMRWYLDGNIQCFRDVSHIVLGVLAIIFLLGLILLIPLVVLMVMFRNHQFFQERYPILISAIDALKAGYRSHCSWWGGIELFSRMLLIGIAIGLPGRTVAPVYLLAFLLFLHIYVRPYKYAIQNIIEAVVLFDYCLLFILRSPSSLQELLNPYSGTSIPSNFGTELPSNDSITYFYWPFFYLPVFMGIGVCIGWIIYRVWKAKKNREKVLQDWQSRNAQANLPISIGVDHFIDHDTMIQGNVTFSELGEYYLVDEKPVSRAINNASVRKRNKEESSNNNKKE
ncbi:PREDICTED: uncharacterized protein LOC109585984 [Amphimedon queenslandica]|uniref:Right handed beta helix domain-containing protein n=1 Tax=Amphimedon queenslandica TaxID=400682 RepID=A0A1X7TV10_AMPQE|nr:PREDICTED: uncharacterized protein LOC109585984 [Amphimedon queenslandica]|eukprot:XP_019857682.1 PREDICTED: uncharacterized protein LOC109585984 [Amphimedon queenslandica]